MSAPVLSLDRSGHTTQRSPSTWRDGLRRNDPATIKALYAAHFPTVRQMVLKNSGSINDAQDVFQEALTVLWLKVKEDRLRAETMDDPGGYLFRVARNKWLDTVRSAAHKHMTVVKDEAFDGPVAGTEDDLEERLEHLRAIYDTLDERCRAVLDRFYFERQDLASIAAAMGVEEESIRTIKYRCMMKLRSHRRSLTGDNTTRP